MEFPRALETFPPLPKPSKNNTMGTLFQDLRFGVRAMFKPPSVPVYRSLNLWIFPVAVLGSSSRNSIHLGRL